MLFMQSFPENDPRTPCVRRRPAMQFCMAQENGPGTKPNGPGTDREQMRTDREQTVTVMRLAHGSYALDTGLKGVYTWDDGKSEPMR
jgi:hypothetical protein